MTVATLSLGRAARRPLGLRPAPAVPAAGRLVGPASVVAASACLQTAAALATTVFAVFGPAGTSGLRFLGGALVLLVLVRPALPSRATGAWPAIVGLGVTTAGASVCLFEALARVPLGTAVTLQFLGPLTVALLGVRRRLDVTWVAAAAAGVVLITGGPGGGSAVGIALALGAAACVGVSVVCAARVTERTAGLDGLALAIAVSALVTLPLGAPALLDGPAPGDLAVAAAVGALGVAAPYALFFVALRRVGSTTYGVLLSLDPAVAALAGVVLLGQGLGLAAAAGIALVVAAGAGAVLTRPAR